MLVSFTNTKGGVGKSTLAVHLAVWLFDVGYKVAILDSDKQRSSSQWVLECEPDITVASAGNPDELAVLARKLLKSHDIVVGDGPAGLDDMSRTLLILSELSVFPISPSILDLRSVSQATSVLKYAHAINAGRPDGVLVLNRMRKRDSISQELRETAPNLGLTVASQVIRDLKVFRDAAQQGTVVGRMGRVGREASSDIDALFSMLLTPYLGKLRQEKKAANH